MRFGKTGKSRRVILLGIDAADWDVIDPLIAKGQLPNFKRAIEGGVRANLHSLESPVSPRVWTSIVTGKDENKHGIFDFYSNRSHLKSRRVWDILNEKGETNSIFYWFVTWPPQQEIRGHMIPGFLSMDTQTVPESYRFLKEMEVGEKSKIVEEQAGRGILNEIRSAWQGLQHGIKLQTFAKAAAFMIERKMKPYDELEVFAKIQFLKLYLYRDVFSFVLRNEPTDFAAVLLPQADQIGHKYWAYYEPERYEELVGTHVPREDVEKYGDVIPKTYREMDVLVGDALNIMRDDDVLMIVSDHGFGIIEEPKAQLKIKGHDFIDALGLTGIAHGFSIGPDYIVQIDDKSKLADIESIADRFRTIHLEGDEEPFFDVNINGEEIILGLDKVWVMKASDAEKLLAKSLVINGRKVPLTDIVAHRADISGDHRQIGVFVMAGKHIKKNVTLSDKSVLDITPTLLYLKKYATAEDMDGSVMLDAFEEHYVKEHPIQTIPTYEQGAESAEEEELDFEVSAELEERLKGLGYMG